MESVVPTEAASAKLPPHNLWIRILLQETYPQNAISSPGKALTSPRSSLDVILENGEDSPADSLLDSIVEADEEEESAKVECNLVPQPPRASADGVGGLAVGEDLQRCFWALVSQADFVKFRDLSRFETKFPCDQISHSGPSMTSNKHQEPSLGAIPEADESAVICAPCLSPAHRQNDGGEESSEDCTRLSGEEQGASAVSRQGVQEELLTVETSSAPPQQLGCTAVPESSSLEDFPASSIRCPSVAALPFYEEAFPMPGPLSTTSSGPQMDTIYEVEEQFLESVLKSRRTFQSSVEYPRLSTVKGTSSVQSLPTVLEARRELKSCHELEAVYPKEGLQPLKVSFSRRRVLSPVWEGSPADQ